DVPGEPPGVRTGREVALLDGTPEALLEPCAAVLAPGHEHGVRTPAPVPGCQRCLDAQASVRAVGEGCGPGGAVQPGVDDTPGGGLRQRLRGVGRRAGAVQVKRLAEELFLVA